MPGWVAGLTGIGIVGLTCVEVNDALMLIFHDAMCRFTSSIGASANSRRLGGELKVEPLDIDDVGICWRHYFVSGCFGKGSIK